METTNWLKRIFRRDIVPTGSVADDLTAPVEAATNVYYRELAFWSSVTIIANAISKVRWRTFIRLEETEGMDYYRLNVQPNQNQNSSRFWQSLVAQLYLHNEALVIPDPLNPGQYLIADEYQKDVKGIKPWRFYEVSVNGFEFEQSFFMHDVFYFQLSNKKVADLLQGVYRSHEELIRAAKSSYRSNRSRKAILRVDAFRSTDEEKIKQEARNMQKQFQALLGEQNGLAILPKGQEFADATSKTTESTRDIRSLIDDIYDMTARAFGIPVVLIKGDVAGSRDAVRYLLTFAIEPLVDLIETELTSKLYSYGDWQRGSKLTADTSMVEHMTIIELAQNGASLISSGYYSVNEIRRKMKEPPIPEDWANRHWMTLNYESAERAGNEEEESDAEADTPEQT